MTGPIVPDLFIEVTTPSGGTYKWDANQPAASRPFDLSFRTKIGEGFSDAALRLARRIDLDYPDLQLGNPVVIRAADGSTVYEGYIAAMPRDLEDQHWIGVTLAGWMASAKDEKFVEIYVDRDVNQWGEMPLERKAQVLGIPYSIGDFSYAAGQGGLVVALPNQALGSFTVAEAWYQAPSTVLIAKVGYKGTVTSKPTGYSQNFFASSTRNSAVADTVASTTLDGALHTDTLTTPRPYLFHQLVSAGNAATPAAGANISFSKLAAYGNHGMILRTGDPAEPPGVYLSELIQNIVGRFCNQINTDGVQVNRYVVQHCAYRDLTSPYDALVDLNKYALWHLGVWENRALAFRPYDFTTYDWEIRTDDPGTTFSPQGPSTESLFNGMTVTYTDPLTGVQNILFPDYFPAQLLDASTDNPWNQQNRRHFDDITISVPVLQAQALELGRAALADRNRPKTPGTLTVTGYIKDAAGNRQPVSKIRAGQMISVTNFPNNDPRLIVETSYDAESGQNSLAIDKPFALLDAYLDRVGNALQAAGLA